MSTEDIETIRKSKIRVRLPKVNSESVLLGVILAMVGGILDAYTFVGRGGVFANAQTANIVLVGVYSFERKWSEVIIHIVPIAAFILGVIATEVIKANFFTFFISKWEHAVLVFEIIILFIIGFLPKTVPNNIVNVTISFATSLQFCSFKKLSDSPYATTMCTGNLRSASQAAYAAFTKKDPEVAKRALRYFIVIFSFLLGTFLGAFLTLSIGSKAVWCVDVLLLVSLFLLEANEHMEGEPLS